MNSTKGVWKSIFLANAAIDSDLVDVQVAHEHKAEELKVLNQNIVEALRKNNELKAEIEIQDKFLQSTKSSISLLQESRASLVKEKGDLLKQLELEKIKTCEAKKQYDAILSKYKAMYKQILSKYEELPMAQKKRIMEAEKKKVEIELKMKNKEFLGLKSNLKQFVELNDRILQLNFIKFAQAWIDKKKEILKYEDLSQRINQLNQVVNQLKESKQLDPTVSLINKQTSKPYLLNHIDSLFSFSELPQQIKFDKKSSNDLMMLKQLRQDLRQPFKSNALMFQNDNLKNNGVENSEYISSKTDGQTYNEAEGPHVVNSCENKDKSQAKPCENSKIPILNREDHKFLALNEYPSKNGTANTPDARKLRDIHAIINSSKPRKIMSPKNSKIPVCLTPPYLKMCSQTKEMVNVDKRKPDLNKGSNSSQTYKQNTPFKRPLDADETLQTPNCFTPNFSKKQLKNQCNPQTLSDDWPSSPEKKFRNGNRNSPQTRPPPVSQLTPKVNPKINVPKNVSTPNRSILTNSKTHEPNVLDLNVRMSPKVLQNKAKYSEPNVNQHFCFKKRTCYEEPKQDCDKFTQNFKQSGEKEVESRGLNGTYTISSDETMEDQIIESNEPVSFEKSNNHVSEGQNELCSSSANKVCSDRDLKERDLLKFQNSAPNNTNDLLNTIKKKETASLKIGPSESSPSPLPSDSTKSKYFPESKRVGEKQFSSEIENPKPQENFDHTLEFEGSFHADKIHECKIVDELNNENFNFMSNYPLSPPYKALPPGSGSEESKEPSDGGFESFITEFGKRKTSSPQNKGENSSSADAPMSGFSVHFSSRPKSNTGLNFFSLF